MIGIEALGVLIANIIHTAQREQDHDRRHQLEAIAAELSEEMGRRCCDLATAWRIMETKSPRRGLRHAVNIEIATVMREIEIDTDNLGYAISYPQRFLAALNGMRDGAALL